MRVSRPRLQAVGDIGGLRWARCRVVVGLCHQRVCARRRHDRHDKRFRSTRARRPNEGRSRPCRLRPGIVRRDRCRRRVPEPGDTVLRASRTRRQVARRRRKTRRRFRPGRAPERLGKSGLAQKTQQRGTTRRLPAHLCFGKTVDRAEQRLMLKRSTLTSGRKAAARAARQCRTSTSTGLALSFADRKTRAVSLRPAWQYLVGS